MSDERKRAMDIVEAWINKATIARRNHTTHTEGLDAVIQILEKIKKEIQG